MSTLKELDLSRCSKITDAAIRNVISIESLEKLYLAETRVTADGVMLLSSLKNLCLLDLGGIPVTNEALSSLQVRPLVSLNFFLLNACGLIASHNFMFYFMFPTFHVIICYYIL